MKTSILLLATIALFALSLPTATKAATQVYDLNADWSDTQNPNGPWSFRDGVGGLFVSTPFPWVNSIAYPDLPNMITKSTEASIVPGYLEVGDVAVIAEQLYTTVRWTAPVNGLINISGGLWGDGTFRVQYFGWTLTYNGSPVSDGLESNLSFPPSRSSPSDLSSGSAGSDGLLNISVQAGDQVNFDVDTFGEIIGINFTITLTSDSVDPVAAIEALATSVVDMNLQNGIENSLDNKLNSALNALDDVNANNDAAACNALEAFINSVEAQRGNRITSAQADQLIASAQEIQALLNCGN